MKHYLLTLSVRGGYLHGYWTSSNELPTDGMSGRLMKAADDVGAAVDNPIILATTIKPASADKVRALITRKSPDKGEAMRSATDFHMTIWGAALADPDNAMLMAMH